MRFNRGGYLIREGFRSIKTHGLMSFATVTIIMACLIIMGSVALLSVNISRLRAKLGELGFPDAIVTRKKQGYVLI